MHFVPLGNGGAVDHRHRQAQFAGRRELGLRAGSSGILAHDDLDGVLTHQPDVAFDGEGAAIDNEAVARQWRRGFGRIDEAQEIMMLRLRDEFGDMHAAQRQHDPAGRPGKPGHGSADIRYMAPAIALLRCPGGAGESDQRRSGKARGGYGIRAHGRGEGMRRVDQVGHPVLPQPVGKAIRASETADAHRDRLRTRAGRSTRVAERRVHSGPGEQAGQRAGLGGTAQKENFRHG